MGREEGGGGGGGSRGRRSSSCRSISARAIKPPAGTLEKAERRP